MKIWSSTYSYDAILSQGVINPYRQGFNGMEQDDEIKGDGNSYDFGARMLDPRLGRWLTIDPDFSSYPYIAPYASALNSPLRLKDPNGKFVIVITGNIGGFLGIFGGSYGAGIAIGDDGIALVATAQKSFGVGAEVGVSVQAAVFPFMHSVNDVSGDGWGIDASGSHLGKFGVGYQNSSGYSGGSGSIGVGEGAHISFNTSQTAIYKISWEDATKWIYDNMIRDLPANFTGSKEEYVKKAILGVLSSSKQMINLQIENNTKTYMKLQKDYDKYKRWHNTATTEANKRGNYKKLLEIKEKMTKIAEENDKLKESVKQIGAIENTVNTKLN